MLEGLGAAEMRALPVMAFRGPSLAGVPALIASAWVMKLIGAVSTALM